MYNYMLRSCESVLPRCCSLSVSQGHGATGIRNVVHEQGLHVCKSSDKHRVPARARSLAQNNVHIREKGLDKICGAISQELTTQRLPPDFIARRLEVLYTLSTRTPRTSWSRRIAGCYSLPPEASFFGQWDLDPLQKGSTLPSTPTKTSRFRSMTETRNVSGRRGAISDRSSTAASGELIPISLWARRVLGKPFLHFSLTPLGSIYSVVLLHFFPPCPP